MADESKLANEDVGSRQWWENLSSDEQSAFTAFKRQCVVEDILGQNIGGNDLTTGICDDATLL
jgi:hypothetical protein